jgi:IS30 family transposase
MKKLSEQKVKQIVELKRKKVPLSEITKRLDVCKQTVIKYTKATGISSRKNPSGRPKKAII